MSSGIKSNIAGTAGIFRQTTAASTVVYPQDTIWLPSPKEINSEIIQPFPVQICKLSYTSSSVVLRTDRGNQKQICQGLILIYTVGLVMCLALSGTAEENEIQPLGHG